MAIVRRDDTVTNTLGNAIAGALVYYLTQPADTTSLTPLASVYSNTTGTPASNPQQTDGFGHAVAYLTDGQLYTIVYVYPNGVKVIYADQALNGSGSGGGGGSVQTPFAGIPQGTVNGTNTVFTLTNGGTPLATNPTAGTVIAWLNQPLILGLGFTLSGTTITYARAPQAASGGIPADTIYAQGFIPS